MPYTAIVNAVTASLNASPFSVAAKAITGFEQLAEGNRHRELHIELTHAEDTNALTADDTREQMRLTVSVIHDVKRYASNAAFAAERAGDVKRIKDRVVTDQPGHAEGVSVWAFEGESHTQVGIHSVSTAGFLGDVTVPNTAL